MESRIVTSYCDSLLRRPRGVVRSTGHKFQSCWLAAAGLVIWAGVVCHVGPSQLGLISVSIADEAAKEELRIIQSPMVARTGPGTQFPSFAELPAQSRVRVVAHDPSGWAALRLSSGETGWVAESELTAASSIVTLIPPLSPEAKTSPVTDGQERGTSPIQQAIYQANADEKPQLPSPPGTGQASSAPSEGNWRPVKLGSFNGSGLARSPGQVSTAGSPPTGGATITASGAVPPTSPEQSLAQLELQFSSLLTRPIATWQLEPLERALADITAEKPSPEQIRRLDSLAQKLAWARRIAAQSRATGGLIAPAPASLAAAPTSAGIPAPTATTLGLPNTIPPVVPPMPSTGQMTTYVPPPGTRLADPVPVANYAATGNAVPASIAPAGGRSSAIEVASLVGQQPPTVTPAAYQATAPNGALSLSASPPTSIATAQELETSKLGTSSAPVGRQTTARQTSDSTSEQGTSIREEITREINDLRRLRFDAVGRLVKAQVRRPSDPPYMIVDERGAIVGYARPASGTMLRNYVGHWVGIMGSKGRTTDGRGELFTVQSVTLLDPER